MALREAGGLVRIEFWNQPHGVGFTLHFGTRHFPIYWDKYWRPWKKTS